MSYYDTCRAQKRGLYLQGKDARIRAERKKLYFQSIRRDPLQSIRLTGLPVSLTRDQLQHEQTEAEANLVPWQAKPDVKIDRFDVRSMLDFYVEPVGSQPKFVEPDSDLEVLLNYERYRMIIRSVNHGVGEAALLRKVDEQLAIKTAHMDQQFDEDNKPKPKKEKKPALPKPENIYDAVGFAYEENTPVADTNGGSDSDQEEENMEIYDELEFGGKKSLSDRETELFANSHGVAGYAMIQAADEENEIKSKEKNEQRKAQAEALDETLKRKQTKDSNSKSSTKRRSYATEPAASYNAAKYSGASVPHPDSSSESEEDPDIGKRFFVTSFAAEESKQSSQQDLLDLQTTLKRPSHRSMAQFFPDLQQILPREEAMMPLSGDISSLGGSPALKRPPGMRTKDIGQDPSSIPSPKKPFLQPTKKLTAAEKMRQRIRGAISKQLSDDQKAADDKHRERENERRNFR